MVGNVAAIKWWILGLGSMKEDTGSSESSISVLMAKC